MREPLYRSRDDRLLFGVAGGMAEWLDLDPAIVRLVWAVLILAGGVGLLLYIVAAIVIPEALYTTAGAAGPIGTASTADPAMREARRDAREARRAARRESGRGAGMAFGLILVLAGVWFLADRYIDLDLSWVMPAVLILIGVVLVFGALRRSGGAGR
jgi:phage shock protein C